MTATTSPTPWLDVMIEREKLKIRELPGKAKNNELIGSRFRACGWGDEWDRGVITDETPWCAAEIGGALVDVGYPIPPKAVNLMARSYLTYGKKLDKPRRGAIGVMPRGNDKSKGHVVCCVSYDPISGIVKVIEGNKNNALVYGEYHEKVFLKNGWRWPVKATVRELREAGSTEIKQADQAQVVAAAGAAATVVSIAAETAKTVPTVATDVVTIGINSPWEMLTQMTERIGILQGLMNAVVAAPWTIPVLAVCYGLWRFGAVAKVKRIIRHMQGQPISAQVYIPDAEDDEAEAEDTVGAEAPDLEAAPA